MNPMNQLDAKLGRGGKATKTVTCESALRETGVDEMFFARKLKDLLGAQTQRWNPTKGSWQKFEDYGIQLAALREIAKIFDIYPKDRDDANGPVMIHLGSLMPKEFRDPAYGEQSTGRETGDGRERCER
jgi:hypothetical protein